jgi:hypothetical protein
LVGAFGFSTTARPAELIVTGGGGGGIRISAYSPGFAAAAQLASTHAADKAINIFRILIGVSLPYN